MFDDLFFWRPRMFIQFFQFVLERTSPYLALVNESHATAQTGAIEGLRVAEEPAARSCNASCCGSL
jgi:hypothetical protein